MSNHASKSRTLTTTLSLLALAGSMSTSVMAPPQASSKPADRVLIAQDGQYVTDYGKKQSTTTASAGTTAPVKTSQPAPASGTTSGTTGVAAGKKPTADATAKLGTIASTKKAKEKTITIVKPTKHECTATTNQWQQFADFIVVKQGQETLPMTLTLTNACDGAAPFRAIRGYLSGRLLFDDKAMKNNSLTLDMTNTLTPGETQLVFEAYGPKGAAFTWSLTAKQSPTVTGLDPKQSGPGKIVKGVGKLLPSDTKMYKVKVADRQADVVGASPEAVQFKVPTGLKMDKDGNVTVVITVAGVKSKPLTLKIAQEPEIKGFSHVSISSGQTMTISGKNFGTDASKVKVTFDGIPGQISGCTDESITVITPEITNIPAPVTVSIEVNGLKSKQQGTILFSMRNVENDGAYSPFEIPAHLR